jgi:hypothetical protein
MDIQTQDGILLRGIPDGTPDEVIKARINAIRAEKAPQQEASIADKIASNPVTRFAIGAAKPVLGAVQLGANAIGGKTAEAVNDHLATLEEMTNRGKAAQSGFGRGAGEVADFAGQVLSPVYGGAAKLMPMVGGTGAIAAKGAALGGVSAAANPVMEREKQGDYWANKGLETGIGAVTGGIATPLMGKLGEAIAARLPRGGGTNAARASLETDRVLREALAEVGQKIDDLPKVQYDQLRKQVLDSFKSGKQLDAAALLRKADFDAAGMPSLLGQITRDPTQYAKEMNLRGVAGVGEPIMERLNLQNKALLDGVGKYAQGASDRVTAGERLAAALRSTDDSMHDQISAAYKAARNSAGKDLEVPLQGLAQDAADILKNFAEKVPGGVKNNLAEYGIFGGKQTKVFTFDDANRLLKNINDHVGADKATNTALAELRTSVKRAMMDAPADDVYAAARNLAAQRFKLHDLVPALKAASDDTVSADQFVRKFVSKADTKDVRALAELLRKTDQTTYQEVRAQLGKQLQRAAFGTNPAGDNAFLPKAFKDALDDIGTKKLAAFFNQKEIDELQRLGRVGAYMHSIPGKAAASTSNSNPAGMALNYGSKLIGGPVGSAVAIGKALAAPVANNSAVNNAIAAQVPTSRAPITPEQRAMLAKLLGGVGVASGLATQ